MISTPIPIVGLHPARTLNHTSPIGLTCIILEVDFKYLLLVGITLDMEVVSIFLTRNKVILARVYNLFKGSFSLVILTGKQISLSGKSICKAPGYLHCSILVILTFTLIQIVGSILTFLCDPLYQLFVIHRMLRILIAINRLCRSIQNMSYQWWSTPKISQQEIIISTKHTSLCGTTFLHSGSSIGKVIEYKVTGIYREIETCVHMLWHFSLSIIIELIEHDTKRIITRVGTCCQHIVSTLIEYQFQWSINTWATTIVVTSHYITHKAFVCSNEGCLCISIGLIEVLGRYYTLLLNV